MKNDLLVLLNQKLMILVKFDFKNLYERVGLRFQKEIGTKKYLFVGTDDGPESVYDPPLELHIPSAMELSDSPLPSPASSPSTESDLNSPEFQPSSIVSVPLICTDLISYLSFELLLVCFVVPFICSNN